MRAWLISISQFFLPLFNLTSFPPLFLWYFNLTIFFTEEDEDAILEDAADLNLPKDENKGAGGDSDQEMPSLDEQEPGQSNNER